MPDVCVWDERYVGRRLRAFPNQTDWGHETWNSAGGPKEERKKKSFFFSGPTSDKAPTRRKKKKEKTPFQVQGFTPAAGHVETDRYAQLTR